MNGRSNRAAAVLLAVLVAAVVGYAAYNLGVSHGLAVNPAFTTATTAAPGSVPIVIYPYGWHRPWGFGLFTPFLVVAFWLIAARALFRGGPWRRHRWHGGERGELPPIFEQWHRRAHERMKSEPSAQ